MNPFASMKTTGIGNPFASAFPMSRLRYNAPDPATYDRNAFDPKVGSWSVAPMEPRQQLARVMNGYDTYYGRGGRGNAGYGGGYSTSAPQNGGFGYGAGGGWGRDSRGNRSSASQGIGMGGRGSFF